jgi:hypothetical protein
MASSETFHVDGPRLGPLAGEPGGERLGADLAQADAVATLPTDLYRHGLFIRRTPPTGRVITPRSSTPRCAACRPRCDAGGGYWVTRQIPRLMGVLGATSVPGVGLWVRTVFC